MDSGFLSDIDDVLRNIDSAEVVSIFFPMLGRSIILDTRYSREEGPMVQIAPMVRSPEERYRSIRRLRPNFPKPQDLAVIPWTLYVDSLIRLGIWDRMIQRFVDAGQSEAIRSCNKALEELRQLEKDEISSAIRGDNYQTIWPPKG